MNDTLILAILSAGGSLILLIGTNSYNYLLEEIKKNNEKYQKLEKNSNQVEGVISSFMTNLASLIWDLEKTKRQEISNLIIKTNEQLQKIQNNFEKEKK